jgi:anaerobic selenocysteine-containing dehydrogenase
VNHGRLGPKGLYGWQGQLHDRLTRPMIRNGTTLVEASWDEAMDLITTRSREQLRPFTDRYGSDPSGEPERLHADGLSSTRSGGLGLLRDLHDLYLLASYLEMAWMVVGQAAKGGRDQELIRTVEDCDKEMESQQQWLMTRMKAAAPQALLVAD